MALEIIDLDTYRPRSAVGKSPIANTSSLDLQWNLNGRTLSDYPARKNWLLRLSDDLLLLIFSLYCNRISAFNLGLACKKLVDLIHGEFYREAAQNEQEIAAVVIWAAQRGTPATLERLSYHLPPNRSLGLDTHYNALISPVSWSEVKQYPNGKFYRYFSQMNYAKGQIEEGLVDLNGALWNGKRYSEQHSVILQHGLSGWTPIHIAALFGNADMVEYLLNRGVPIGSQDHSGVPRDVMFYAAVSEQFDVIQPCMVSQPSLINQQVQKEIDGGSPMPLLAYLCVSHCFRQARSLLQAGAKASYKTSQRKTLLHLCTQVCTQQSHHQYNFYRPLGSSWQTRHCHLSRWTQKELTDLIRALIVEGGVDPNAKDRTGNTFLHHAAKNSGPYFASAYEALASLMNPSPVAAPASGTLGRGGGLIKSNNDKDDCNIRFDVDAQNLRGETVLMLACDSGMAATYKYDSPLFPGSQCTAMQVFLETLQPSMGLKDRRGSRVTDRICSVQKRKKKSWNPGHHPAKPYLLAYIQDYLQFPVSPPSFGPHNRPKSFDNSKGSTSSNDGDRANGTDNGELTGISSFKIEMVRMLQQPSLVFRGGSPTGWKTKEIDGVMHCKPDPNPGNEPWTIMTYY